MLFRRRNWKQINRTPGKYVLFKLLKVFFESVTFENRRDGIVLAGRPEITIRWDTSHGNR